MVISYSTACANIFLHFYEKVFIDLYRYIDDLIVFNSDDFEKIASKIYPRDLVLERIGSILTRYSNYYIITVINGENIS